MDLIRDFHPASHPAPVVSPDKAKRKRLAPFSIRLSEEDRARLSYEAAGAPLGAYIKAKVLADAAPLRARRTGHSIEDRKALARIIAILGRSDLFAMLNAMAEAAACGSLLITPDTEAELAGALADVRDMRTLLIEALGLKAERKP